MNPMPGPLLLLLLPLLAAGVAYLLRRWAFPAALLSAATTAALALLCLRLPLDRSAFVLGREVAFGRPVVILGQTLMLDPAGQVWLASMFALATIFFLFAWRMSQGRSYFAFGLAVLVLYVLVVLLQTFSLAVLVFGISAVFAVFIVQAGQFASVRGAQRYLLVTLLAVPLLLAAAWLVGRSTSPSGSETLIASSPDVAQAIEQEMARRALVPALLGFGLLLATFPFGTWMPALAADAPPLATAFVFTLGQAMALYLAFLFLRDSPALLSDPSTAVVIQLAGLVMAAAGGVMAAVQRDFGRLLGFAALANLGVLLLAFVSIGSQGVALSLLHTVARSVSIALMAAALAILRHRATTDRFSRLHGMARRLPVTTLGLMLGGLSLAGFPLTAGFPTYWAVSRAAWNWVQDLSPLAQEMVPGVESIPGQEWIWILTIGALLAASAGVATGLLRGLNAMLGDSPRDDVDRQPAIASLMVLALGALSLVLGLYPQLFLDRVLAAARAFPLF